MKPGAPVVVNNRVYEVVKDFLTGMALLRDGITMELKYVDFYLVDLIDPHKNPTALLEAMGALEGDETNAE